MLEFLEAISTFLWSVWRGIGMALELNPRLLPIVETYPQSRSVIVVIAVLAGASQLLGQSVVLFVNRVSPGRFALSLFTNGVLFAISLLVWGAAIWLASSLLFSVSQPLGVTIRIVALGSAPFVFGFLVLIPYLGTFISRMLWVWSLLIVVSGVKFLFGIGFIGALVCVGLGWLVMMAMSATIGKPIIALRNRVWHRVVGSSLDATTHDILKAFVRTDTDDVTLKGGKL